MPTHTLSQAIINAAILGFERQKQRIDAQLAELRAMLSGESSEPAAHAPAPARESGPRKRKGFSAATKRKMALAQKARWAKIKEKPAPQKRKLSPAAKAKLAANLKKARAAKAAKHAQAAG